MAKGICAIKLIEKSVDVVKAKSIKAARSRYAKYLANEANSNYMDVLYPTNNNAL